MTTATLSTFQSGPVSGTSSHHAAHGSATHQTVHIDLGDRSYPILVGPALLEMRRQVQDRWDGDKMLSGMIVRHLILPGNTNSAIEALNWLHSHLPGTYVSLMAQYTPMPGLERYPELTRAITRREYDKVVDHALALGMDNVF